MFFKGNIDTILSCCIIIASHISSEKRINYLIECLKSLLNQTVIVPIYLSISFETEELNQYFMNVFLQLENICNIVVLYIQPTKTAQMRHILSLYPLVSRRYNWVMFSDDDDSYLPSRVENFIANIDHILQRKIAEQTNREFAGLYENQINQEHSQRRHEYWCYCVRTHLLGKFLKTVQEYPEVLDNKCCDVFFAEFLRRLDPTKYMFGYLTDKYYNYRTEDNADSVTGIIQSGQKTVRTARIVTPENRQQCIDELNSYLTEHLTIYLNDFYLYSVVGVDFDSILQREFKTEYCILSEINPIFIEELRTLHEKLLKIANIIYDIPV